MDWLFLLKESRKDMEIGGGINFKYFLWTVKKELWSFKSPLYILLEWHFKFYCNAAFLKSFTGIFIIQSLTQNYWNDTGIFTKKYMYYMHKG